MALAAALRFWGIGWGLPYLYQTEEYRVIKYALRMGGGDLNPHIFEYPSLYLYFMLFLFGLYFLAGKLLGIFASAQAFAIHYVQDPTAFHLIGRVSEALFSMGVLIMVYHLGKKMFSRAAGLFACAMIAVIPYFVEKAHNTKGDMAAILLGLLFWNSLCEILKDGEKKQYYIAGALLGLMITTKYYMAMLGIAFPIAHLLSERRAEHRHFFLAILLTPAVFVLGTPYSVLSSEFYLEFKSVMMSFGSGSDDYWSSMKLQGLMNTLYRGGKNLFKMYHARDSLWFLNYGFGLVCLAGMVQLLRDKWKTGVMLAVPVAVYWAVVGSFKNPDVGYYMPLHPLIALAGGYWMAQFVPSEAQDAESPARTPLFRFRWTMLAYFAIAAFLTLKESGRSAWMYGLKDTRTTAKEWIDQNLPAGSKVVMDLLPYSPPLEMTRDQIAKFADIAQKENNYKAEYFKLKLESLKPGHIGYEVYLVRRHANEIGVLPKHLTEVQKVQDLVDFKGDESDFALLRSLGIRYVIFSQWAANSALTNENVRRLAYFYQNLDARAVLLKDVPLASAHHPGPAIKIYELSPQPVR